MGILKWRFESIKSKFDARKGEFLRFAKKLEIEGENKGASEIKKLVEKAESKIEKIRDGFKSEKVSIIKLFFLVRGFVKTYKDLSRSVKPWWQALGEDIVIVLFIVVFINKFLFTHYNIPSGSGEPSLLVGDRIWGNKLVYRFKEIKRGDQIIFDDPNYDVTRCNFVSRFLQEKLGISFPPLGFGPVAWTKRVIGIPGDMVEGKIEDGKAVTYLNGEKLDEPYLNPYPLILIKRKVGLVDGLFFRMMPILSWLATSSKERFYTYDPDKSLSQQPFYSLKESEILRNFLTGEPVLKKPFVGETQDVFGPMRIPEGKYWVQGDNRKNSHDARAWGFLDREKINGRASFITYSLDSEEPIFLLELLKHPIEFWTKRVRWSRFGRSIQPFAKLPES
ncbi:signal peptidase I [Candidatus Dependentiae bacterium]